MSDDFPSLQDASLRGLYRPVLPIVLAWRRDVNSQHAVLGFPLAHYLARHLPRSISASSDGLWSATAYIQAFNMATVQ